MPKEMEKLFLLNPEVSGGLGNGTVISNFERLKSGEDLKPDVTKLEYVFDDWLGDHLLTSTPCYIVTVELADRIGSSTLTGYRLADVTISKSGAFYQLHKDDLQLPDFVWLQPLGSVKLGSDLSVIEWSGQDFSVSERDHLVVTEKCLEILKRTTLNNCEIISL